MVSRSVHAFVLALAVVVAVSLVRAQPEARAAASAAPPATAISSPGASPASTGDYGAIARVALKYLGQREGECFPWVRRVVLEATGRQMGRGYRAGYLDGGAVEISIAEARSGDVFQLIDDRDTSPYADYIGMHTAIVLDVLGGGLFNIIDSNSQWDGVVRIREGYDPLRYAARYAGISVHVYRFPGNEPAQPAPPASPPSPPLEAGDVADVRADGDCLNLRTAPALAAARITCLPEGLRVTVIGPSVEADGYRWLLVQSASGLGWVAGAYLARVEQPAAPPPAEPIAPAPAAPAAEPAGASTPELTVVAAGHVLRTPPVSGLTFGVAGAEDPAALVAAQPFPVESVSAFEIATQRYLTYIPGAPAAVNTLTADNLQPGSVVVMRRSSALTPVAAAASPLPPPAVTAPSRLPAPPPAGLTLGLSGTSDPAELVAAQEFAVSAVWAFDVATQRFLAFIPGAPPAVSNLTPANLRADSVVMVSRAGGVSTAVLAPAPSNRVTATLSYYYCAQGQVAASIGDGGGFCGVMANGETVYAGAAACDAAYLGRRFTIEGDPTGRTYSCADTGSAVGGEHRDIWFATSDEGWLWLREVGTVAVIEVLD